MGALHGSRKLRIRDVRSSDWAIEQLGRFASGASVMVGHNVVDHDRRVIEKHVPRAELLRLPVVDTLYLAPLARPQRPYHSLVKDYKLVGAERSDPVADCRLALRLLEDCWHDLEQTQRKRPGLASIYRTCFDDSDGIGGTSPLLLKGTGNFLGALGARMLQHDDVLRGFDHFVRDKACTAAIRREVPLLLRNPATRPAVAYCLAWLMVAGTQSILPRWVHHRFPAASRFLSTVRGIGCEDPGCAYCPKHHDSRTKLAAGLMFHVLWKWQYSGNSGDSSALRRAASVALPPLILVYAVVVVITNISVSIQLAILLPVLGAVFTALLVLRDPAFKPSERDRLFLLSTTSVLAMISTALGVVAILAIYLSPDLPSVLPDHNQLRSWEIDFSGLGITTEEALDRLNLGYLWHAIWLLAYMFFVVGGRLMVSIYRIDGSRRR